MFARSVEQSPHQPRLAGSKIAALLSRLLSKAVARGRERQLRISETLSLGEKRFIAVVEYGRQKFLLGGTPHNISLLQRLDDGAGRPDAKSNRESVPE
jgi:flagellar biogenesis protein FliO